MSTLLRYALTTDPFPLLASPQAGSPVVARLTLVATNATSSAVSLEGISVTLPIGSDAAQLTANSSGIGPVPPDGWSLAVTQFPPHAIEYIFQPAGGVGTLAAGMALTFIFNNVNVNTEAGTCEVSVMEGSGGCQPPDCPTAGLDLTKFPSGWGSVSFWVNPPVVPAGGAATLHWSGPAGATYAIEYYTPQSGVVYVPAQGQPALLNQGQYPAQGQPPLALWQTTVFTLNVSETVSGKSYFAQEQLTVTAESQTVAIISFKAVPNYVPPNYPVSLQWKTQFAASWVVTPGDIDVPVAPPNDQGYQVEAGFQVKPSQNTLYYLNAEDSSGNQVSSGAQVTVDPKIVSNSQTVDYAGQSGEPGWPGAMGSQGAPGMPGAYGAPGTGGGPGPDLNVTVSLFDGWLLQVEVAVAPSTSPAATLLVAPPAQLLLRSVGGAGGQGGPGGAGGQGVSKTCGGDGGMGGGGGHAGPGGNIVVNCPTSLKAQAQSYLTFESSGGTPGAGGPGGAPGSSSRSGCAPQAGTTGVPGHQAGVGTVTWNFT